MKTSHEVELMRHANKVTIEAFRATFQTLKEGMAQSELSRILSSAFQKLGYNGVALVLATHNAELATRTDRVLEVRDGQLHELNT